MAFSAAEEGITPNVTQCIRVVQKGNTTCTFNHLLENITTHSLGVRALLLQGICQSEASYEDDNITTGSEHDIIYQIPRWKKQNPQVEAGVVGYQKPQA